MNGVSAGQVDILLVDDRAENLLALEAILESLGQHLVRASSGEEALRQLLQHDFAVILLDVQMPGMSGFETAQMIKSRERTKFIPIIFLTAINKGDEHVFEGYSAGAVDYMFKPFQPEILRSKVQVFVDLSLQQRRIAEQDQQLRDIERQQLELRHMRALVQSEARFREIVSSAMDAIIAFDAGGSITLVNGAAERMFGTQPSKAIGSAITRFFPDGPSGDAVSAICASADRAHNESATNAAAIHPHALKGRRENGEIFPMEASVSCLDTESGRIYTVIVRDISSRVERDRALERQAEALAASAQKLEGLNAELRRHQLDLERAMTA
ncbi:MAG TPA: response regulator, partial [Gemmatimonadaceae bacterium]|nr:response regulator [Gemmatimonadaceae bacterium]